MLDNLMKKRQSSEAAPKEPDLDNIMSQSHEEPDGDENMEMGGDPLKSALTTAGFDVTEDKLAQIKAILGEPGGASPLPGGADEGAGMPM